MPEPDEPPEDDHPEWSESFKAAKFVEPLAESLDLDDLLNADGTIKEPSG